MWPSSVRSPRHGRWCELGCGEMRVLLTAKLAGPSGTRSPTDRHTKAGGVAELSIGSFPGTCMARHAPS